LRWQPYCGMGGRVKLSWRVVGVLAAIWIAAGSVYWFSRAAAPSPEKLRAFLASRPLGAPGDRERAGTIAGAAARLNRLNFDQRRALREDGTLRQFFEGLTPEERTRFLELTLPEGFRQMMDALNKMDPAKRKRLVQRALEDIRRQSPQAADRIDQENVAKIIAQGVSTFYEEANADVKLDFAPVLEELQRNLQSPR